MIEPRGHFLLVEIEKVEEVTKGGLILVKEHKDREQLSSCNATVLELGFDCWFDKPSIRAKVGDKIIIAKYAGVLIDADKYGYGDSVLRLIDDEDVLAVISE